MERQIERKTSTPLKKAPLMIKDNMRKELELWLGASWTNDVYDNFIQKRLDGTCDWILHRPTFLDWMGPDFPSGASKILWINGPAGHGKTILCARVVQYLSTMPEYPLAYYFCSSESEARRDSSSIMRSWVSQIISSNRDAFELACSKRETNDRRTASQADIIDLLRIISQHIPSCTFVVDGIDECAWATGNCESGIEQSPKKFFESISSAVANTATRILILSRDEPEIRHSFRTIIAGRSGQDFAEYQIRPADVRPDTTLFSRSIIDSKLANKHETLKTELSQRMANRCDGMFLWVKMLEDQLRSGKNQKQLEETIDQTPTALSHLYDRNWMRICQLSEKDKLRAFTILRWAAFALRPLTVLEITEALIVDDDAEDLSIEELPDAIDDDYISTELQGLCGSLLEIRKAAVREDLGSMTIHLAHFSVKQYVLCNLPVQGELLIRNERLRTSSETSQSNMLAKLCLRYLNFRAVWREPVQPESDLDRRPFRDYAAGSWYQHATDKGSNYEEVVELANFFFGSASRSWESWKRWFDGNDDKSMMPVSQRTMTSTNPLFYASLLGLRDTLIYLLEEAKQDVNQVDEFKRTALQAAALKGRTFVVELLLEKGADITVGNEEGWTPLNLAAWSGHLEIVKLLLQNGADIAVSTAKGFTPLQSASRNGHVQIVNLLFEKGADIKIQDNNGWTPLHLASRDGNVHVVKLLLEKGADITIQDNGGWTPLNLASVSGHVNTVKLLLQISADISVASICGWTPINAAADGGYTEVVKLLLENGADIAVPNNAGWTPINAAADGGHTEVVKMLLENGADIAVPTNAGSTPLYTASSNGHIEVVKLLLENGADFTTPDTEGMTPIYMASCDGHSEVVKLLIIKGAGVNTLTNNGWTPVSAAADGGHIDVVKVLLENGVDVNLGRPTAISVAARGGYESVVELLFGNGAKLDTPNAEFGTIINASAYSGSLALLRLLVDKLNFDYSIADEQGRNAAHFAARGGHAQVLEYVLELGVDPYAKDVKGDGILHYAACSGSLEMVRKALSYQQHCEEGMNVWTPLHWACRAGNSTIIDLLLDFGTMDSVVTTSEPPGRWAPSSIAIFHQNIKSVPEKLRSSTERTQPNSGISLVQAEKHGDFWCDGCQFVSFIIQIQ
jgi:ankyrin repeat protein